MKPLTQKDIHTPMFTAALFTIAEMSRQHKCPLADEWIKKMCFVNTHTHTHTHTYTHIHTHSMEYYSSLKRRISCHL